MKKIFMVLLLFCFIMPFSIFAEPAHKVTNKAEMTKVGINLRTIGGGEKVVVFSITLKNTDKVPHVYNVMALVDDTWAGVGIIPADEQQKARINPGEEATGQVAVTYDKIPTNFFLTVDVDK